MRCNPVRSQLSPAVKRQKSTLRMWISIWMSVNRNVWHIAKRFPLKGGLNLCIHNKVLSVEEKSSWCVFCTYPKRSLCEAKGIQEIKGKPMGKCIQCFVLDEKTIQPLRRFGHEYNQGNCQAPKSQVRTSTSRKYGFYVIVPFQHHTARACTPARSRCVVLCALCALAICQLQVRGVSFPRHDTERIIFLPPQRWEAGCVMEIWIDKIFSLVHRVYMLVKVLGLSQAKGRSALVFYLILWKSVSAFTVLCLCHRKCFWKVRKKRNILHQRAEGNCVCINEND